METMNAVVEEADVCKISDLFRRKPPGLGFNETDALKPDWRTDGRLGLHFISASNLMELLRKSLWAGMPSKPEGISLLPSFATTG